MKVPRVFADFQNADERGRLRLTCRGTVADLKRLNVELTDGMTIDVFMEDIEARATVEFSETEQIWVAVIDWNNIKEVPFDQTDL